MSTHPTYEDLNDWIDGVAEPTQAQAITAHIASCDECNAIATSLRQLLNDSASLPKAMPVPAEIWEGVAAATVARRSNMRDAVWQLRYPLAAAATFLIAITAAVTLLLSPAREKPVAVTRTVTTPAVQLAVQRAEADYGESVRTLEALLSARRAQLDPATVKMLDQHLVIIDGAIRDAKAALAKNPDNKALPHMITGAYERKVNMLTRALRSSRDI